MSIDVVPGDDSLAARAKRVSEGAVVQLGLSFLVSPARADPFLVAPLVCLYAVRESDRRAMLLYLLLGAASAPLDLAFLLSGAGWFFKLVTAAAVALKCVLVLPGIKLHDMLPALRGSRAEPAELQARVQAVVQTVLRAELQRMRRSPPLGARGADAAGGPPSSTGDEAARGTPAAAKRGPEVDTAWEEV